jgi:hypothetical protein
MPIDAEHRAYAEFAKIHSIVNAPLRNEEERPCPLLDDPELMLFSLSRLGKYAEFIITTPLDEKTPRGLTGCLEALHIDLCTHLANDDFRQKLAPGSAPSDHDLKIALDQYHKAKKFLGSGFDEFMAINNLRERILVGSPAPGPNM